MSMQIKLPDNDNDQSQARNRLSIVFYTLVIQIKMHEIDESLYQNFDSYSHAFDLKVRS